MTQAAGKTAIGGDKRRAGFDVVLDLADRFHRLDAVAPIATLRVGRPDLAEGVVQERVDEVVAARDVAIERVGRDAEPLCEASHRERLDAVLGRITIWSDFAFIDGDHRFEAVFVDLYFMTRLLRPEGLIVMDDMWMPSIRTAVAYAERNLAVTLEPDALPDAFRWRHRPWRRGVPSGTGGLAVLRCPAERPELRWDAFVPPY